MITTIIRCLLSVGCFLLVNAGKMVYYNDRLPVAHALDTVPTSYYWPNEDVLPIDEPDAMQYPAWFQLPWKPIPLRQPCLGEEPEKNIPSLEVEPPTTTEDNTPHGRHLHHEKPHKHHHHHKHHKHHKNKHHHHDKGFKSAGIDEFQDANVGQLKMVILQLEHKLQELKLQLFGGRTLTNDVSNVENNDEDTARLDDHIDDHDASEEVEPSTEDVSRVLTDITPISEAETDEGKILLQEDVKPASELELEHREIEGKPFDNGQSLEENVKKWFEGLDLGKIAALPLEVSVESEDVLGTIDVRGNFQ